MTADELKADLDNQVVFDVRKPGEFEAEHLPNAENTPLDFLNDHMAKIGQAGPLVIHCAGGYRSVIAASILKSRGIHQITDLIGGFKAIKDAGMEVTQFQCPSKS